MDPQPVRGMVIAPMSLGEVVDNGFTLARRHFRELAAMGAWAIAIGYLCDALLSIPTADFRSATGSAMAGLVGGLGAGLASIAVTLTCARLIDPGDAPDRMTAGEAYRQSLNRLPALLGLFVIIVLTSIPLLIVFPLGIYIWIRWTMAWYIVIVERQGPIAALKRSWNLSRKAWWHMMLVWFISGLAVGVIEVAVAGVLGAAFAGAALAMNAPVLAALGNAVVGSLLAIVATPFPTAVGIVLYYELRARAEGLDLERRMLLAVPGA